MVETGLFVQLIEIEALNALVLEHHPSTRRDLDDQLRLELADAYDELFGAGLYAKEGLRLDFFAVWLTRMLDTWDLERPGYTLIRNAEEARRYLDDEIIEYINKPDDPKEWADVVIFANRLFYSEDATPKDRQSAVMWMKIMLGVMETNPAAGLPQELIKNTIETNSGNYDRSACSNPYEADVRGMFKRRKRYQFGGNIPPIDGEKLYGGLLEAIGPPIQISTIVGLAEYDLENSFIEIYPNHGLPVPPGGELPDGGIARGYGIDEKRRRKVRELLEI